VLFLLFEGKYIFSTNMSDVTDKSKAGKILRWIIVVVWFLSLSLLTCRNDALKGQGEKPSRFPSRCERKNLGHRIVLNLDTCTHFNSHGGFFGSVATNRL
jgi:hypothetical protein